MKQSILLFISIIYCFVNGWAQNIPNGINYQAVARNNEGKELPNTSLEVRFSIQSGETTRNLEWEELHNTKTNEFGLFTLVIGEGERTGGSCNTFDQINWGSATHFLKVEVNFSNSFVNMGTTQMVWVPYALYALKSGNGATVASDITYNAVTHKLYVNGTEVADLSDLKDDATNAVQNLSLEGNNLIFSKSGQNYQVDFSKFMDNTDNQNLSITGQVLKISNANEITLPVQVLSVDQNTLKLSNGGGSVLFDPSSANELQFLRLNADTLEIYRPGMSKADGKVLMPDLFEERDTFYIKGYPKPRKISLRNELKITKTHNLSINRGNNIIVDTDTINEIQDLSLTGDILKISNNKTATSINLASYKDNTDKQTLTLNETSKALAISGGNSIDVSNMVNIPWVGFSCIYTSFGTLNISANNEFHVPWVEEFDDSNNVSNNIFTPPASGTYSLSLSILLNSTTDNIDIKIYKKGVLYRTFPEIGSKSFSTTLLLKLDSTDTIEVRIANHSSSSAYNLNMATFSGYRVH